ncbi:MAG TPA: TIR domain-containing protein [Caulobacteraceae bacterium]|nr:TIR domain-containing protein [Caulobacteraceae bacterium]
MAHDVFISYSSKDKPAADAACARLEAEGIRCWIAPRDIVPGAEWAASIIKAIAEARVFVLLLSANANTSPQIPREVERAVNHAIPVIPVRLEDVVPAASLEYFINTPHWLDAFNPPLDAHLAYLARVVRTLLDTGAAGSTERPAAGAAHAEAPRRTARPPRWALAAVGGLVVLGLAGGAAAWFFRTPAIIGPAVDPQCLTEVASVANPGACQALLSGNGLWQSCAAAYAQGDGSSLAATARSLIARGKTGDYLYETGAFRSYGAISHYWEMFSQCVNQGDIKFDDIVGGISFPDDFWTRTEPLRAVIGANWNGPNQAMPANQFMSNFRQLCASYRDWRNKQSPGGGASLDCSR